ncbi:MAG TPA: glucose-6-phosphate dehydrogenase, partial [Actinomycetota bacterium]|nr:glucose-6-phosphate dehydrogenase [Actinomycetota bacterium]
MGLGRPDPQNIVIFGASGDLTSRKVMPALYNLFVQGLLPEDFCIVGYARTPMAQGAFIDLMRDAVGANSRCELDDDPWAEFSSQLRYVSGEYADADGLGELIPNLDGGRKSLFYCATPPSLFPVIAQALGALDLAHGSRIVIEKPFGRDLDSAKELNGILHENFAEEQIFRIDHYLGKETVQNILVFRFANGM